MEGRALDKMLEGKVVMVTGAGRGIGRCIALTLAEAGAELVLAARSAEELAEVSEQIRAQGGRVSWRCLDVSDHEQVCGFFRWIESDVTRLDVLINNAGIGVFGPLAGLSVEDFDRVVAVNMRGTFLCSREALNLMRSAGSGTIINIASVVGFRGYPNQSAYSAAKHGVMGLTKSMAAETQASGIRVCAVLPGGVDTEMVRKSRPDLDPTDLLQPQDVAQAVMYLLSLSDRAAVDEIYIRRRASRPF